MGGDPLPLIRDYALERVGETLVVDMVAITQLDSDPAAFIALAAEARQVTGKPLILRSPDLQALAATAAPGDILCATVGNLDGILSLARERGCALSLSAPDLDALVAATTKRRDDGFTNLLLQFETHTLAEQLQTNTIARRAAIRDSFKPLGFPFLRFIDTGNPLDDTAAAVTEITKYGSVCVLPSFNPAQLATLLTLRQNIFTDPQKPIQVEPRLYPIGEPTTDSPVFVTTNFSLTFFIVSGEIENSGISAWLVVPECEGMSVLTAWAAGKFSASTIAKFIKETGVEDQVRSRRIVIPGYVASISGELEDNLPGWQILVGPEEASDLEGFIKTYLA